MSYKFSSNKYNFINDSMEDIYSASKKRKIVLILVQVYVEIIYLLLQQQIQIII